MARGRAFRVDVTVDGERIVTGDLTLSIEEADALRRETLRSESRESANRDSVVWAYELAQDTWVALKDLHRSRTMVERSDVPDKTSADMELLGEERERQRRHEATSLARLTRDLSAGKAIFRGQIDDVAALDLRRMAQRLLEDRLDEIYPRLAEFTAELRRGDVLSVLRTADLAALPESLHEDGIGLVRAAPDGHHIITEHGPLAARSSTKSGLGRPTDTRRPEVTWRATSRRHRSARRSRWSKRCAPLGLRVGVLQAIHQGQRLSDPDDTRLDQVFGTIPRFRSAAFELPSEADVPLEVRVDLAQKLEHRGQPVSGHATGALAAAVREALR